MKLGSGVAAGAAAGAGVDLLFGGLTLGVAALTGAIAGGAFQTERGYGNRLMGKLKGQRELTVDDNVLRLLALRQSLLLQALESRGHAATESVEVTMPDETSWREGKLPDALITARAHAEWSAMNKEAKLSQPQRLEKIKELADLIAVQLDG
jgi:hypothetical protein